MKVVSCEQPTVILGHAFTTGPIARRSFERVLPTALIEYGVKNGVGCNMPALNAKTYGPPLNKAAGGGDDEIMREYINNGTPRMPAFKYYLKPDEIEAIIAYVRTVPVPAAAPAARPPGGGE